MNNNSGDFFIQLLAIFVAISLFFIILVGFLNHVSLMEYIEEEEKKKTIKMRAEEERKRLEIEAEEEEKRLKREAEEAQQKARQIAQLRGEQERLKRQAEEAEAERIRTQSQIWVIG